MPPSLSVSPGRGSPLNGPCSPAKTGKTSELSSFSCSSTKWLHWNKADWQYHRIQCTDMSPNVPWTNHARQMCLSAALLSSEWNQVSALAQQHCAQGSLSMCGVEWFPGQGRASALPAHCCSFALGMGLLGILQHNAINTEQPLIDQRKGWFLPLLVPKQHCNSALWLGFHPL